MWEVPSYNSNSKIGFRHLIWDRQCYLFVLDSLFVMCFIGFMVLALICCGVYFCHFFYLDSLSLSILLSLPLEVAEQPSTSSSFRLVTERKGSSTIINSNKDNKEGSVDKGVVLLVVFMRIASTILGERWCSLDNMDQLQGSLKQSSVVTKGEKSVFSQQTYSSFWKITSSQKHCEQEYLRYFLQRKWDKLIYMSK